MYVQCCDNNNYVSKNILLNKLIMVQSQLRQSFYPFIGILIGLCLSLMTTPLMEEDGCLTNSFVFKHFYGFNVRKQDDGPTINILSKPQKAQKVPQKLMRPRYFSTELGIKDKLLVAVLTTQATIEQRAVAINKTLSHLVDKLMFFIDAPGSQKLDVAYLKLPGIVGFVDTRSILKPFHVLKYIKDNFIENYDFFFIVKDNAYIKGRQLYEMVQEISVSRDVYASKAIQDSLFCSLDAGILFSNSVLQKMLQNIDWCVKNAFSSSDDDNLGRCVLHSTAIPCQQNIAEYSITSFDMKAGYKMEEMEKLPEFNNALTIFPINHTTLFYKLHKHFIDDEISRTELEISALRRSILGTWSEVKGSADNITWPIGNEPGNKPTTRFDLLRWNYITENYSYLKTDFDSITALTEPEKMDIQVVMNSSREMIDWKYEGKYKFVNLENAYRRFDPSRGMDYKLDMVFRDITNGQLVQKRLEICKPLGKVEVLPVPYVTENRRIVMVIPVKVDDKKKAYNFLKQYKRVCLEKKEKIFLLLVFLYEHNVPGKGRVDDVFAELKNEALVLTRIYQKDDNRVGWLSVKLPAKKDNEGLLLLDFALMDLALKKSPPDTLVLYSRLDMDIRVEYLNRVRMNTILNWQVFSPVPFSEYNPLMRPQSPVKSSSNDVNKRNGHYDNLNTQHVSFYVKDYYSVRKLIENLIPIVKSDSDLLLLEKVIYMKEMKEEVRSLLTNTIYSMFVRYGNLHVLRAIEPGLRLRYQEQQCDQFRSMKNSIIAYVYQQCIKRRNSNLGSRSELSKLILQYQQVKE